MFKVKKGNRVLTVNETEKAFYLSEGYDVVELVDGDYDVIEKATGGRTYSVAEYNAVVKERDELKAQLAEVPKEFDRQTAMDILKEKGVEFPGNIKNDNLKKLLEENA